MCVNVCDHFPSSRFNELNSQFSHWLPAILFDLNHREERERKRQREKTVERITEYKYRKITSNEKQ